MNTRVAQKVMHNVYRNRKLRYKPTTIARADQIDGRGWQRFKDENQWWFDLMEFLGPSGRAELVGKRNPAAALKILMESPEDEWEGDPSKYPFVEVDE